MHASHKQQISSHDGGTTTASGLHTGQLSEARYGDSVGLHTGRLSQARYSGGLHTGQLSGTRYCDSVRLHTGQLSEARYSGGLRTGPLLGARWARGTGGGGGGAPSRVPARRGARGCAGAHGGMRGRAGACGGARGRKGARGDAWGSGGACADGVRGGVEERRGVRVSASGAHKSHMGISPQEKSSIRDGSAHRVRLWAAGALWARGSSSSPPLPGRWGWGVIRSRGRGKLGVAGEKETRAMHWCVECGQSIASKRVYGRKHLVPPPFFFFNRDLKQF